MADEGFNAAMEKLKQINDRLGRISGELPSLSRDPSERMPSQGFIIFWMGFVPLMGFLLGLIIVAIVLPRLLLP